MPALRFPPQPDLAHDDRGRSETAVLGDVANSLYPCVSILDACIDEWLQLPYGAAREEASLMRALDYH